MASTADGPVAADGSSVIRLNVRVNGKTFSIPCGDGSQDIKWLASVAAKRYELSQRSGGRSRARESSRGAGGAFRPCNVKRKPLSAIEADVVGPGLTIREMVDELREQARVEREERERIVSQWQTENARRVRAGQPPMPEPEAVAVSVARSREWEAPPPGRGLGEVADGFEDGGGDVPRVGVQGAPFAFEVELTTAPELASDGGMRQTLWSALAHNHSEPGYRKAMGLREAYRQELLARAEEVRREEERRTAADLAAMGELLDVDMDDPRAVQSSLDADWVHIRVESVSDGPEDVRETKMAVLEHFAMLNDVYRHYCGDSLRGDASSMQLQEFEHLLATMSAMDVVREGKVVAAIFHQVNAGRKDTAAALDEDSMSRFEFIEAMLHVARHRNRDKRTGVSPPCCDCFRELVASALGPEAERLGAGEIRRALRSSALRRWLARHHESLRRVFDFYCKQGSRNALFAEASVLMDEEEFFLFLEHAGFLVVGAPTAAHGMGGPRNIVTRTGAREAFAGVQRDNDGSGAVVASDATGSAHLEQMAFHEFIEGVARIALQRWGDDAVPVERRIAWALSVACDLEDHLGAPPPEPLTLPAAGAAPAAPSRPGRARPAPLAAEGGAAGLAGDDAASVDAVTASLRPTAAPRAAAPRASVPVVAPMAEPPADDE